MSDFEQQQSNTLNSIFPLISDNRDTGHGWYVSVRSFNSGDVEALALKMDSEDSIRRGGGAKREKSNKQEMNETVLRKSQHRARKTIRHKLMTMCADRMLTLTYRENMTDLSQAWTDLKKFSRLMKETFPDQWNYVCVPEYQKRGAVHFHMAISGFYNINVIRNIWRSVVGEGNIDITSPKHIDKNSWNPKRIANYLAKYISKNDSVEFNKRRYSSTQITIPPAITGWIALGMSMPSVLSRLIEKLSIKQVNSVWSSNDGYFPIVIVST